MVQKSVPDLIFDKFKKFIVEDDLFDGISDDLLVLVRSNLKKDIEELLRKNNENSEPRN